MLGRIRFLAAALIALGPTSSLPSMAAPAFDRLVVFGDSLSDTGNAGRFSNGPVWVEQLAARLGLALAPSRRGGLNFAVGGARLDPRSGPDSLRAQADLFLARSSPLGGPGPTGRALHVVSGGGNDVLAALGRPDGPALVDRAAVSLASILGDLAGQGAGDVLVPNLPNIGMTPAVRARGSRTVAEARDLTLRFNGALDRALTELARATSLRVYRLDVWTLAERVTADPAALGFTDAVTPCQRLPACEGHLFWDDVHPTTRAHGRLAEAATLAVSP